MTAPTGTDDPQETPAEAGVPGRGAIGGAADEGGSGFRSGLAAYIAAHVLRGDPFVELALPASAAIPRTFVLEGDKEVDDIEVGLSGGDALIQAKRKLNMATVGEAAEQWVKLARASEIDIDRLRLVVAGAEGTKEMVDLQKALDRNRREVAGAPTKKEREALGALRGFLDALPADTREQVLRCGMVWLADLEEEDGLAARLGRALLEPGVVAIGQGGRAWRALRREARDLARRRYGAGLGDIVMILARDGLSLTADAQGYAAARHLDRQERLDAYRRHVRERGEYLDLGILGAPLPPIPLSEIDASVSVYEVPQDPDTDAAGHNGGLPWALRRRGRALLLGPPGSGKSVALRAAAAHYAARPDWPLPMVASLQRVGARLGSMGFEAALLEVAFENEPVEDQPLLRAAGAEHLRSGEAAIFLDALDESRSVAERIVAGLREELGQCDTAVEVLLSTRDATYSFAHTLEFDDLRLSEPDHPERTVEAVLRAAAAQQGALDEGARPAWVRVRREWIEGRLEADDALRKTPLMVVLLTLAAVEHDEESLPNGRAEILRRVVDDVVGRWEAGHRMQGEPVRLGALEDDEAILAAKESFAVIGSRVYGEEGAPIDALRTTLAGRLQDRFGLAPASAEVAAQQAIGLWDEAGVFVGKGGDPRVRTRIQLFAELACALAMCEDDAEGQRAWALAEAEGSGESQPLLLASGLSRHVAETVAHWTMLDPLDPARLDLCRTAIEQGAEPGGDSVSKLVERLLEDGGAEDETLWKRALLLIRLPVAKEKHAAVLAFFSRLEAEQLLLARALAVESWGREDEVVDEDLRAVLKADPERFKIESGPLRLLAAEPDYEEALLVAARGLIASDRPTEAELFMARSVDAVSMRTSGILRRLLRERGFSSLVLATERSENEGLVSRRDWSLRFREDDEALRKMIEMLRALDEPRELDLCSRRRLDRLVALFRASGFNQADAGLATRAVLKDPASLECSFRAAAELADFDLGGVAAEASEWLRVNEEEHEHDRFGPIFMLGDGGAQLRSRAWDRITDPVDTARALAHASASPYGWVGQFAVRCLLGVERVPTARDAALEALEDEMARTTGGGQLNAAVAAGLISENPRLADYVADTRPMVRRAGARLAQLGGAEAEPALAALLGDRDGGVRREAADAAEKVGLESALAGELAAAVDGASGWECVWCGNSNGPESGRCSRCKLDGHPLGVPSADPITLAC